MAAEWHPKQCHSKNRAPRTLVHLALETWELRLVLAFGTSSVHCDSIRCFRSHLQSAAGLIRFFCQLEQYPHQFGVIQWLLAAEEPIVDKTHHRRLGSAKFG